MVSVIGKIVLGLALALLICGCGAMHDPSSIGSGVIYKDYRIFHEGNESWDEIDAAGSFDNRYCVPEYDIGLDYCTRDPLDPQYQFWLNEAQVGEKMNKWLVKI